MLADILLSALLCYGGNGFPQRAVFSMFRQQSLEIHVGFGAIFRARSSGIFQKRALGIAVRKVGTCVAAHRAQVKPNAVALALLIALDGMRGGSSAANSGTLPLNQYPPLHSGGAQSAASSRHRPFLKPLRKAVATGIIVEIAGAETLASPALASDPPSFKLVEGADAEYRKGSGMAGLLFSKGVDIFSSRCKHHLMRKG